MEYFTNYGPVGRMKYRDVPGSLGVLTARDQPMPVGQADCLGPDENGNAVFVLTVGKVKLKGRWWLVNREFIPAQ